MEEEEDRVVIERWKGRSESNRVGSDGEGRNGSRIVGRCGVNCVELW